MKIIIENFGPISNFEIDLSKDLTCIYGDNNIGKSYSMQIVYLLLKSLKDLSRIRHFRYSHGYSNFDKTEQFIDLDNILNEDFNRKEITSEVYGITKYYLMIIFGETFYNSCKATFSSFNNATRENSKVILKEGEMSLIFRLDVGDLEIESNAVKKVFLKSASTYYHKSRQMSDGLNIYVVKEKDLHIPRSVIIDYAFSLTEQIIDKISMLFVDVHFLPASRSGIYNGMSAFSPIVAELVKNKAFFTKKIEFPGLTEPISDYFIKLSSGCNRISDRFKEVYGLMEKEILLGEVTYDRKENTIIYATNNGKDKFRMTEVSSMVSEISPIIIFLKYILGESQIQPYYFRRVSVKPIIFIEEPEAHLHPHNQVKLTKAFAELVKHNVKIIISSHSNYIFNKFNNLVLSGEVNYKRYQPLLMLKSENGSKTDEMEIDETGVMDTNFADISLELLQERDEILESLNNSNDVD